MPRCSSESNKSVAAAVGRQVEILFASTDLDIDAAFAELQKRVDAFVVPDDVILAGRQTQILTLAARQALPASMPIARGPMPAG
jgi:putative ABC transport system substrate-binding protein